MNFIWFLVSELLLEIQIIHSFRSDNYNNNEQITSNMRPVNGPVSYVRRVYYYKPQCTRKIVRRHYVTIPRVHLKSSIDHNQKCCHWRESSTAKNVVNSQIGVPQNLRLIPGQQPNLLYDDNKKQAEAIPENPVSPTQIVNSLISQNRNENFSSFQSLKYSLKIATEEIDARHAQYEPKTKNYFVHNYNANPKFFDSRERKKYSVSYTEDLGQSKYKKIINTGEPYVPSPTNFTSDDSNRVTTEFTNAIRKTLYDITTENSYKVSNKTDNINYNEEYKENANTAHANILNIKRKANSVNLPPLSKGNMRIQSNFPSFPTNITSLQDPLHPNVYFIRPGLKLVNLKSTSDETLNTKSSDQYTNVQNIQSNDQIQNDEFLGNLEITYKRGRFDITDAPKKTRKLQRKRSPRKIHKLNQ